MVWSVWQNHGLQLHVRLVVKQELSVLVDGFVLYVINMKKNIKGKGMKLEALKPRNLVAKDLRTPKYRMRVVSSKKQFKRNDQKEMTRKELAYGYETV